MGQAVEQPVTSQTVFASVHPHGTLRVSCQVVAGRGQRMRSQSAGLVVLITVGHATSSGSSSSFSVVVGVGEGPMVVTLVMMTGRLVGDGEDELRVDLLVVVDDVVLVVVGLGGQVHRLEVVREVVVEVEDGSQASCCV